MGQTLVDAAILGSIYVLFCLGMSLVWGTVGILNFAHGAIFMFAGFVGYLVVDDRQLPMIGVIAVSVIVGALLSTAIEVFAFQPILERAKTHRIAELQILIGGIGVAAIPLAIAQYVTKSEPFGFANSSYAVQVFSFLGLRISNTGLVIVLSAVVLTVSMAIWLRKSMAGLALRAIGVDSETAALMGVDRRTLSLATMAFAGGLAGLAGALLTFNLGAITPESGETLLIKAFAVIILGGVGSTAGVAAGAYILALSETLVLRFTGGGWVDAVCFGMIFLVLLLRPQGLFGRKEVRRV
ncbi:branched-chain amino acid ABC transporter permease [Rhodococcus sp. ARC_M12]|uniref:branched-chain amino acid ABC transporter permease n=1 Tax=Rhodococcus sp. ARC_M12 TaxID=2928854 RepID=UPI001FB40F99|nr:branched-chain amino acid ABC transporter permease [Rhodococcus sp. ARC_M12]MCJ0977807.1 branched-chain amino acid ABC transporter permease [Rhodococcus sp. ARC_M12]